MTTLSEEAPLFMAKQKLKELHAILSEHNASIKSIRAMAAEVQDDIAIWEKAVEKLSK